MTVIAGDRLTTQALVVVPIVDEWTGSAPESVRARSLSPGAFAHVADGQLVVTGRPARALPSLDTTARTLEVVLDRPGRAPQRVELVVPAGSALPWRGPAVPLAATAVAVAGRVREKDHPHSPVADATVEVRGVAPRRLVALRAPLALAHDAGVTVGGRALTETGTTTASATPAGSDRVVVASPTGIGGGTVLAFGERRREEHVTVQGLEPGNVVVLRLPLVRSVPDGAPVRRHTTGALTGATSLVRAALPGDGLLVTVANSNAPVVEVSDGGRTELRSTNLRTDGDGGWRLDGARGISRIELTVNATGLATYGPVNHPLLGTSDPNVLDVEMSV
ncbi:hypothetical protein GO592_40480 (plasmid) [Rhodococcus sp. 21391]|nr:hypothetical protein [Rhodococcus opacus]QQZ18457.1 hypothetical protein GO592_40480 [Rhodococcus sp. 21391]